jgi:hypothetical protein
MQGLRAFRGGFPFAVPVKRETDKLVGKKNHALAMFPTNRVGMTFSFRRAAFSETSAEQRNSVPNVNFAQDQVLKGMTDNTAYG